MLTFDSDLPALDTAEGRHTAALELLEHATRGAIAATLDRVSSVVATVFPEATAIHVEPGVSGDPGQPALRLVAVESPSTRGNVGVLTDRDEPLVADLADDIEPYLDWLPLLEPQHWGVARRVPLRAPAHP